MISLLLSLVLLAGMTAVVPTVGAAETQSEQTGASGTTGSCTWSLSGTVLTISGNGRMKDYNVSYGTKPPWGTNITQVIVNYGVTYIGEDAFYGCENLTEVHLADGTLTEIGESAFSMCKNLEEIVIPDSVETIQSYVFGYCFALKEVTLSKNLSFLGFDAFLRCHALEHIELPDSITSLLYVHRAQKRPASCTSEFDLQRRVSELRRAGKSCPPGYPDDHSGQRVSRL